MYQRCQKADLFSGPLCVWHGRRRAESKTGLRIETALIAVADGCLSGRRGDDDGRE